MLNYELTSSHLLPQLLGELRHDAHLAAASLEDFADLRAVLGRLRV